MTEHTQKEYPSVSWGWTQGYFWDLWMVVHILAGMFFGSLFRLFSLSDKNAIVVTITLLIAWEIFEKVKHITEPWLNTITDVVVGAAGFLVMFFILPQWANRIDVVLVILLLWTFLSVLGWRAWLARKERPST